MRNMRFRTLALALALCCGLTGMAEAKKGPKVHKIKHHKGAARVNGVKIKPHKVAKRRTPRRVKHS